MNCPDKQMLSAWMDDELKGTEAEKITNHVNSCSECKSYVNSQKFLETAWREGWQDPAKKDFEQMRNTLQQNNPSKKWWKSERTWYIAAVFCAAYLGVKIFVIDKAGTSLSEIAISETSSHSVSDAPAELEASTEGGIPTETLLEIAVEAEYEEESQEEIDDIIQQVEDAEVVEEIVEFELSASDLIETSSSVEGSSGVSSGYSTIGYGVGGLPEEATGDRDTSLNRTTENTTHGLSGLDAPAGFASGDAVSTVSGGAGEVMSAAAVGGGGSASPESVGGCVTAISAEYSDQEVLDLATQPACIETAVYRDRSTLKDCSVQVVLSSGTISSISSSLWPSLFDLLESILENNPLFENREIMLLVDETGVVTGPGIENDTAIELPDQSYSDCVIHIHF